MAQTYLEPPTGTVATIHGRINWNEKKYKVMELGEFRFWPDDKGLDTLHDRTWIVDVTKYQYYLDQAAPYLVLTQEFSRSLPLPRRTFCKDVKKEGDRRAVLFLTSSDWRKVTWYKETGDIHRPGSVGAEHVAYLQGDGRIMVPMNLTMQHLNDSIPTMVARYPKWYAEILGYDHRASIKALIGQG